MGILVGTSGFQFPDWVDTFYPPRLPKKEWLSYYSAHFDTLEVNFTFYSMPGERGLAGMVESTPEGFLFCVKLNRCFTHDMGEGLDREAVGRFKGALRPMIESGKLGCLLAQFPNSFRDRPENRRYIAQLRTAFAGVPFAVEFRHVSWQKEEVFDHLAMLDAAYVCVDLPRILGLPDRRVRYTAEPAYVRLHSRNARNWFKGEKLRYDYCYSESELREWVGKVRELAWRARRVFVFFNNCYAASAVRNALTFRRLLGLD